MGLLALFSKKSYSDLKTCAYDATVASSPPIRGTYPVLGNGSKILEQFQRSHPNLTTGSHLNPPVPSPLVTRLRRDGSHSPSLARPSTAPSSQLDGAIDSSSLQVQPRAALPLPPKKKYGPYRLPPKVSTDIRASSVSSKPMPSPGLVSLYSDSIRSIESNRTRGYVDLLDAQSMIKPLDFYGRVQATGVRNYGEDVADRNRQETGANVDTAMTRESPTRQVDEKWNSVISKGVDDDSDEELPRRARMRHSVGSGLRTRHMSTHLLDALPKRTSSLSPAGKSDETPKAMSRTASARSERAARRKSMPSLAASASTSRPRSSLAARRGKEKDLDLFPNALRDQARAAIAHERESTKPNISTKRQSLAPAHAEHQPRQRRGEAEKPLPTLPVPEMDRSRRRSITHNAVVESRLLVRRQSTQGMRAPSRGEIYEDTYQQKISLQTADTPGDWHSARRQLGSTTDLQDSSPSSPARQPDHSSQMTMPPSPARHADDDDAGEPSHLQKQSLISLSGASVNAHELDSSIPARSSSLRHWSLTSETALSTQSSNPFRPQSGHTTSTSVDFSPLFPHARPDRLIPPVPDIPHLKSLRSLPGMAGAPSPTPSLPPARQRRQSDEFYLEDYASSNESTTAPSRSSYEKDLLFSDAGYGAAGDQLSGLPGLLSASVAALPSADSLSAVPGRTAETEIRTLSALFHLPSLPGFDSEGEEGGFDSAGCHAPLTDSSDDEMNFDIPMSRAGSSALRYTPVPERFPPARRLSVREGDDGDDSDY
ncbi:hypothetical protein F4802DRAFT_444414 [Xylaria palmicola]|nr:hypothetical protein F4802DRAFT_444414 [Xylaria palmicola]